MAWLDQELHPYAEDPMSKMHRCICGHLRQHHLHEGVSSAVCCCMGCIRTRDPDDPYGKSLVDDIDIDMEAGA